MAKGDEYCKVCCFGQPHSIYLAVVINLEGGSFPKYFATFEHRNYLKNETRMISKRQLNRKLKRSKTIKQTC